MLLSFFVGSSWAGNVAYAYDANPSEGHYPVLWHNDPHFALYDNTPGNVVKLETVFNVPLASTTRNAYYGTFTKSYSNVGIFEILNNSSQLNFTYTPDLYDYYFLGTVSGQATNASQFSFVPNYVRFAEYNCEGGYEGGHFLQNLTVYHHDDTDTIGFTIFGKMPDDLHNTSIYGIQFGNNAKLGSVPAGLRFEGLFIALPKGSNNTALLNSIYSMLSSINSNIVNQGKSVSQAVNQAAQEISKTVSDSVSKAADDITSSIEDQYEMDNGEDFGVGGIVDQVEDEMGVLSFGADVLTGFLDLFSPGNVAGTVITFPAFAMEIGGETYNVWQDLSYDLTELEEQFGFLIDIIRTFLVSMVWLAVLKYIVNSAESFWKG